MENDVIDYISREIVQDPALLPLSNETPLLESGIRDALSLLRLVAFLEERFGITVRDADMLHANFHSVKTICAYVQARESVLQGAAHE
jgi:2-hydroxymuconate-semialdehyde hydrolase